MDATASTAAAVMIPIMLVGFGMMVVLPLAAIWAVAHVATKRAHARHLERMAMIERGIAPADFAGSAASAAPRAPFEWLPWAVGLLVAGAVWFFGHFAAILVGVGAGFLTRGILETRRENEARRGGRPPGGIS